MTERLGPNDEAIEAWNTVLFDKFVRYRDILTTGLGSHGDAAMSRNTPPAGARVLDVGCGFGDTTRRLAAIVGREGEAVGVDAAERFIEGARSEATESGVTNVRFLVADVQSGDLGGPYKLAFSRMGTMFFSNPVQAMRNVRRSLSPGGRLCMVVWRKKEANAFLHEAENAVKEIVPIVDKGEAVTCGPGPFSMASPDVVSDILVAAGFQRPTFQRNDDLINIGKDLDEAVEFAMELGPAGEIIRLAGAEGERLRPKVVVALHECLAKYARPEGVLGPSSVWIVTADNP